MKFHEPFLVIWGYYLNHGCILWCIIPWPVSKSVEKQRCWTPSDPNFYGSCDKSKNPYPVRNRIMPCGLVVPGALTVAKFLNGYGFLLYCHSEGMEIKSPRGSRLAARLRHWQRHLITWFIYRYTRCPSNCNCGNMAITTWVSWWCNGTWACHQGQP